MSLFCFPERSIAKLLTVGQVLVDAHKNGSVYFATHIFGDSALLRRKRDQILQHPDAVRAYQTKDVSDFTLSVLSQSKPIYFKQRHRKSLYRDNYCERSDDQLLGLGNIIYLIQACPLTEKRANRLLVKMKETATSLIQAKRATSASKSSSNSSNIRIENLGSVISTLEHFYTALYRNPNFFACRKLKDQVLLYTVVFGHLVSHVYADGFDSLDTWQSIHWRKEEVNLDFAVSLHEAVEKTSLVMVYGVTSDKHISSVKPQTSTDTAMKVKKRKVSATEQVEIQLCGGPLAVAICHENMYPAAVCRDGYVHTADFVTHCNYAADILPELEALYFTVTNFPILLRQYKRSTLPLQLKLTTDSTYLDMNSIQYVGNTGDCNSRVAFAYLQKYSPPHLCTVDSDNMKKVWSGDLDSGVILFEHLTSSVTQNMNDTTRERPRCWAAGPFTEEESQMEVEYSVSRQFRRALSLFVGEHSYRYLVLQDLPLPPSATSLTAGKPYLYYFESIPCRVWDHPQDRSPHVATVTKQIDEFVADMRKCGLWESVKIQVLSHAVTLLVLYNVMGSVGDWDYTFVQHDILLTSTPPTSVQSKLFVSVTLDFIPSIPSIHAIKSPLKGTHHKSLYRRVLGMFDNDVHSFVRMYSNASETFLSGVERLYPDQVESVQELFSQDVCL